ncbi:LOW QUALITY PROTEIN: uncharacterized protein ccdc141 [Genypterus blacodes]|uniref:LOW QUALITY PROTEIN: uncharacterized protein ccdc141 n=1 Tax=Genypterus blacodes TaxID=154954 RepID=UPI003F75C380
MVGQQSFILTSTADECFFRFMTSEETEKMDGGAEETSHSFTTLSTIAIQAGQSQITASVLKSGSLVHLQLVQVHPGLCEIGSNWDENHRLTEEQRQLLDKLKKHETEFPSLLEKHGKTEDSRMDRGTAQVEEEEEVQEEEVYEAMAASLSEGWTLLIHLLERRQEVLTLAAEFYRRTTEFSVCMDRLENLQLKSDDETLREAQLRSDASRRDLLSKSLQVLTSSNILLHKLGQLQRTEALYRTGGQLQGSSQWSCGGSVLRLEQLVENLQDRRRRADQNIRLQIQNLEDRILVHQQRAECSLKHDQDLIEGRVPDQNMQSTSKPDQQSGPISQETVKPAPPSDKTRDLQCPESKSEEMRDRQPESRPDETRDLQCESRSDKTRDLQCESRSDKTRDLQPESRSDENRDLQCESRSETRDLQPESRPDETRDLQCESRSDKTRDLQCESRSDENRDLQCESRSETRDLQPESGSEETRDLPCGSRSDETRDLQCPESKSEEMRDLQPESRPDETRDLQCESRSETRDLQPESRPDETRDLQCESRSETRDLQPESRPDETRDLQCESRSETRDLQPESGSDETRDLQHESGSDETRDLLSGSVSHTHQVVLTNQQHRLMTSCEDLIGKVLSWVTQCSSFLSNSCKASRCLSEAEESLNKHLQLRTEAEVTGRDAQGLKQILDQISALQTDLESTTSPHPATRTRIQLSTLKALTEQLRRGSTDLQTNRRTAGPSLPAAHHSSRPDHLSSELTGRAALSLEELQSLNMKINSNLHLLQHYVVFLRMAQQVEDEMAVLREIYTRRPEQEEQEDRGAAPSSVTCSNAIEKKQADARWQEVVQRFLTTQDLGNSCIHAVTMVSGATIDLQSVVSGVQQMVERLSRTKQEVSELCSSRQTECNRQQEDWKYQQRLHKTQEDMTSLSKLLDSCTQMDLGSDLQTARLLGHFSQARPHFNQLDTEVEHLVKSWGTLRGVQDRMEVKEEELLELLKLHQHVKEKIQQSEKILDLTSSFHRTAKQVQLSFGCGNISGRFPRNVFLTDPKCSLLVKARISRICQKGFSHVLTESCCIRLVRSFNSFSAVCPAGVTVSLRTLETLYWFNWFNRFSGSSDDVLTELRQRQQQIQNLIRTTTTLKTEIDTAVNQVGSGFMVDLLDSLCVSWMNEAARQEEKMSFNHDIVQLHDAFKDLKQRFSSLKFHHLKKTERTRTLKAVRNQLMQTELYDDMLQTLKKQLQGVAFQVGSEVRDEGGARQREDVVNELQRMMGELHRNIAEHRKTLNASCKLQQAMDQFQLWCEEASATIARVRKVSSRCWSKQSALALWEQFEELVWPTVPEQEQRMEQIGQLAMMLHGVEEGRSYIQQTLQKHSEMIESIRELSHTLKLDALTQDMVKDTVKDKRTGRSQERETEDRLKDGDEEEKTDDGRKDEHEEEETGDRLKDKKETPEETRRKKKEQRDNRKSQEAFDMCELKETGHTPELTTEHDGREVAVKRQSAANRKPPLQKMDRQTGGIETRQGGGRDNFTSSHCCSKTFSFSSSPVEIKRRVHTIISQSQPSPAWAEPSATPPPSGTGSSFCDIQREFGWRGGQMGTGITSLQNASVAGPSEADLQHQEVMTDDSLSNDEYECTSPDDISLPPLSETPESNLVQSDMEESFCFSSHSVHRNQYSLQYHNQSESRGTMTTANATGEVQPVMDTYPSPPSASHSRSESTSFVQSLLTVPADLPQSADLSRSCPESSLFLGSKPVQNNTQDSCPYQDNSSPQRRAPKQTELQSHSQQYNLPQYDKAINQNTELQTEGSSQTVDSGPQKIFLRDKGFLKSSTVCNQADSGSFQDQSFGPHQDTDSLQTNNKTVLLNKPQSSSVSPAFSQRTVSCQSSKSETQNARGQSETHSVPRGQDLTQRAGCSHQAFTTPDCAPHKHYDFLPDAGLQKSNTEFPLTGSIILQGHSLQQPESDRSPSETSKETHLLCNSSSLTTTSTLPEHMSDLSLASGSPLFQASTGFHQVLVSPEPNSVRSISGKVSNRQSLHESLASTCTQQSVHDPGLTPSSLAQSTDPPQPEVHVHATARQANQHAASPSFPAHLLTSDQDLDICRPMTICEEIRLTPQIQGPPLPPPLPQVQTESLPQGKTSKPITPRFTRPLSRATLMGGSPVMLEVEVTGHANPTLTWWVAYNQLHNYTSKDVELLATGLGQMPLCKDEKHFLSTPAALESNSGPGKSPSALGTDCHRWLSCGAVLQVTAENSRADADRWLVAEVCNIISEEWNTWFCMLCFLLWVIYLIIL